MKIQQSTENPLEIMEHSKEIGRLNRIRGQVDGIKKMIEERRSCKEIMSQLKAVRSAVRSVEASILQRHLQYCAVQSFNSEEERNKKIEEIKELFNDFHE